MRRAVAVVVALVALIAGVLVGAVPPERRAPEGGRQPVEGGRRGVEDEDLPAGAVQLVGQSPSVGIEMLSAMLTVAKLLPRP